MIDHENEQQFSDNTVSYLKTY